MNIELDNFCSQPPLLFLDNVHEYVDFPSGLARLDGVDALKAISVAKTLHLRFTFVTIFTIFRCDSIS